MLLQKVVFALLRFYCRNTENSTNEIPSGDTRVIYIYYDTVLFVLVFLFYVLSAVRYRDVWGLIFYTSDLTRFRRLLATLMWVAVL